MVNLASALDPDGVDVYFLNREPLFNVRSSEELTTVFAMEPEGIMQIAVFCFFDHRTRSFLRFNPYCPCPTASPPRQA